MLTVVLPSPRYTGINMPSHLSFKAQGVQHSHCSFVDFHRNLPADALALPAIRKKAHQVRFCFLGNAPGFEPPLSYPTRSSVRGLPLDHRSWRLFFLGAPKLLKRENSGETWLFKFPFQAEFTARKSVLSYYERSYIGHSSVITSTLYYSCNYWESRFSHGMTPHHLTAVDHTVRRCNDILIVKWMTESSLLFRTELYTISCETAKAFWGV